MNIEVRRDLSDALQKSYEIFLFLLKNLEICNEEDLDLALEVVRENTIGDLGESCKWFERVRFTEGYNGTFYTNRLIRDLFRFRGQNIFNLTRSSIQFLASLYDELRGCAQILLVYRNKSAHVTTETKYELKQDFYRVCTERVFEILLTIESILGFDESSSEKYSHYIYNEKTKHDKKTKNDDLQTFSALIEAKVDSFVEIAKEIKKTQVVQKKNTAESLKNIESLIENIPKSSNDISNISDSTKKSTITPENADFSVEEAERKLLELRDKIYRDISAQRSFKPYENILQRPIIKDVLNNHCIILPDFLECDEYKRKRSRNDRALFDYQVKQYGHEIEIIIHNTNYSNEGEIDPFADFDDDIPF